MNISQLELRIEKFYNNNNNNNNNNFNNKAVSIPRIGEYFPARAEN